MILQCLRVFFRDCCFTKQSNDVQSNDPDHQQKILEFFEMYCPDCNNGSKVVDLIKDFKLVDFRFGV